MPAPGVFRVPFVSAHVVTGGFEEVSGPRLPVEPGGTPPGVPGLFTRPVAWTSGVAAGPASNGVAGMRRRLSLAALLYLLALAPVGLASAVVLVVLLVALRTGLGPQWEFLALWVLPVLWWAPFPVVLTRWVQRSWAGMTYGCREPTTEERQRLLKPWRRVCARAGLREERFSVLVCQDDKVDAHSAGRGLLWVTTGALRRVDQAELEAMLAHELGHHLRMHHLLSVLAFWLMLPLTLARYAVRGCWKVVIGGLRRAFSHRSAFVGLAVVVVSLLLLPIVVALVVPALVGTIGRALMGLPQGVAEFEADLLAAELGTGAAMLRRLEVLLTEVNEHTALERVLGLQPLVERRTTRLRAYLETRRPIGADGGEVR